MKFTVTRRHLMIALYVLGGMLILYGLVKLIFKISLGPLIEDNLPTVVMVGAAVIFVWNRDLWKKEEKAREEEEARKKAEEEAAAESPENSSPEGKS
jgi:hypothetical protein